VAPGENLDTTFFSITSRLLTFPDAAYADSSVPTIAGKQLQCAQQEICFSDSAIQAFKCLIRKD
jgi:hypothetical protein